jgi:2,6-dihydroxypyridine 3-monooxygenase
VLLDCHGRQHKFSVARGAVRLDAKAMMRDRADALLRPKVAEVVTALDDPFVQLVVDVRAGRRAVGRLALIGDAACVARPHAGAGALKATEEAIALGRWMSASEDMDTALARPGTPEATAKCKVALGNLSDSARSGLK